MRSDKKSMQQLDLLTVDNLLTPEKIDITAFLILGP